MPSDDIDRSDNIVTWTDSSGTHTTTAMGMWGNNSPNAAPTHPCHELIEADNINDPSQYRAGMYFPGRQIKSSWDKYCQSSVAWYNAAGWNEIQP